jgi:hypothetical protein
MDQLGKDIEIRASYEQTDQKKYIWFKYLYHHCLFQENEKTFQTIEKKLD